MMLGFHSPVCTSALYVENLNSGPAEIADYGDYVSSNLTCTCAHIFRRRQLYEPYGSTATYLTLTKVRYLLLSPMIRPLGCSQ
jgi:hypothetical protein